MSCQKEEEETTIIGQDATEQEMVDLLLIGAQRGKRVALPPCDWKGKECVANHLLKQCPEFIKMTEGQRLTHLRKVNRCFNCFRLGHSANKCQSKTSCGKCEKAHNTMVHGGWERKLEQASAMLTQMGAKYSLHTCLLYTSPSPRDRG